jgi:hypothetical protein
MKRLAAIAVVLVLIVWLAFDAIFLRLPGLIDGIRNPTGPNREVEWELGPATPPAPAAQRPPNIVVIVADDLGWNDLGFQGGGVAGGSVPTPNIDSIASDGVRFNNGYSGSGTCAPSRTGRRRELEPEAGRIASGYPGRWLETAGGGAPGEDLALSSGE